MSGARWLQLAVLVCVTGISHVSAAQWAPKTPRLATPWTSQVSVNNPLPEYPRPSLTRPEWQSLNGIWDFAVTQSDAAQPVNWPEQIRVPFPVESALSGIERMVTPNDKLWYRRTFAIPDQWQPRRVQLNFGASDWQTTVWVNNRQVGGTHTGGYDSFSYDISDSLNGGTNTIVVSVYDPTDAGQGAIGKQRLYPVSIFYTAASGIWQTVWLEPTPGPHLTRLDMTPDLTSNSLRVIPRAAAAPGHTVLITVTTGTTIVGSATGIVDAEVRVPVPNARRWSPDDPYLYDVRADILEGSRVVDSVGSYAGMRSITLGNRGGILRPMLNGSFVFEMGALDQGYWPDGIYTAPTDEALRFDVAKLKELGFNLVRKHMKVEPQRWYYWADRIGLMVWQDMPATRSGATPDAAGRTQFENELRTLIDQHRSSPSVVTWVPFNEGWGEYDPARIANDVTGYDSSRLVSNNSGANCCGGFDGGNGDFIDEHVYVGPGNTLPSDRRAAALGEYGGLGLKVPDHQWSPGSSFSYEDQANADVLTNRYLGLIDALTDRMRLGLSIAVFTQVTDVEGEVNGIFTYDRQVQKMPTALLFAAHTRLINGSRAPIVSTAWAELVSKNSGKCLDVRDISTAGGALLQQWACWGGDNQKFAFTPVQGGYQITVKGSSLQLDVDGGPGATQDGAAVIQWPYWGGSNEIWQLTRDSDGYYTIAALHSGKCLDVSDISKSDGAPVHQWTCWGGDNQKWQLVPGPTVSTTWAELVSKNSGKCLDVRDISTASGALLQQWACLAGDNQKFAFTPVQGGYQITVKNSSLQINIDGGPGATQDGAPVIQSPYRGGSNEMWQITSDSDGYYTIVALHSGKCVDVSDISKSDGAPVHQWTCWGGDNQKWQLIPVQ
ncbi:MAG: RICIN domain-containing protein [Bryobacteraceae bacterium]